MEIEVGRIRKYLVYGSAFARDEIFVEQRSSHGRSLHVWAVTNSFGECLDRDGQLWHDEPSPSNRDESFYRRTRFRTFEAALAAAEDWALSPRG